MVTMIAAAMAGGNRAIVIPSEKYPLAATDFYQVLRTSDVPGGVVNIVTGGREELAKVLADHYEVDAIWYHGTSKGSAVVEKATANSNLKQSWVNYGKAYDWNLLSNRAARDIMQRATQIKNIWAPWGEGIGPK
jgi:aldehyde dehydrogenase (NAD+)